MNTAEIRATLESKLASLGAEIAAWRAIVEKSPQGKKHPDFEIFTRHQSQVLRISEFFAGLKHQLAQEIANLGTGELYENARQISDKILQGHALWSYFRGKLLFRYSAHLRHYLLAADEFAWTCYKPFLAAQKAAAGGRVAKVPPLIYLGRNLSPFVYPREWSLASEIPEVRDAVFSALRTSAPFSVISLPYYQTAHLPETMVLAHEMGHVVEYDCGLTAALDAALAAIPEAEIPGKRQATWKSCRIETFADLFGAAAGRLAFCRSLAAFLAADPAKVAAEQIGSSERYAYPSIYLRVLLTLEVLRVNGNLPAGAEALLQEWQATYGTAHLYQEYEKDLPRVVAALLDTELTELGSKSVRSLVALAPQDDVDAAGIAQKMLAQRVQPPARDTRILFAAAALAFYQDPQQYGKNRVESMVLDRIAAVADNAPRSAESIPNAAPAYDRQAGATLAGLLGATD